MLGRNLPFSGTAIRVTQDRLSGAKFPRSYLIQLADRHRFFKLSARETLRTARYWGTT